ncbi:hypothetical protein [Dactylosporangium sp. NPDC051541]|uniref:CdiA C-terminal domain-containing protein n=1 Tax=Dactylosporangium sp. NPDC051541 TaxID=3363977 RepID=UPI0037A9C283
MEADTNAEDQRGNRRENEAAVILARNGFRTYQRPFPEEIAAARAATGDVGNPTRKPDYLIEGFVWDCYSPLANKSTRGVWTKAKEKVDLGQTQRVVLNLEDWGDNVEALRRQFADWAIDGLKEVMAITNGQVVPIWNIWGEQ